MDETSVKIIIGSSKNIHPVGTEKLLFPGHKNEKKYFTFNSNLSLFKEYDLIFFDIGRIDQNCKKFGNRTMACHF